LLLFNAGMLILVTHMNLSRKKTGHFQ